MDDPYQVMDRIYRDLEEKRKRFWDYMSARALGMIKRPEDEHLPPDDEADEASEEELEELNEDLDGQDED